MIALAPCAVPPLFGLLFGVVCGTVAGAVGIIMLAMTVMGPEGTLVGGWDDEVPDA